MPELVLIFIRSVTAFILLLVMTRIMGKKQLSQLTFFDYCVGITIGSVAATMSVDQNVKMANGFISLIIWGLFPIILAYLGMKNRKFIDITDGRPAIVIKNGEVLEKSMKQNQLAIDELMMLLREKSVFKIEDVEMAVLETNGELSILKKATEQAVTPKVLGIQVEEEQAPTLLIADGALLEKNIAMLSYSKQWVLDEIKKQGASDIKDVFIAQINDKGKLYVDLYDEKKTEEEQSQQALLSDALHDLQIDLTSFSKKLDDNKTLLGHREQVVNLQKMIQQTMTYLSKD
ncbi:MAG TPA: DUF421 domain-containing protein [Pseudogracilibacillus sp.]|nr:DUF421 domain-containing protein [Pseudogracilibacillus sp.]